LVRIVQRLRIVFPPPRIPYMVFDSLCSSWKWQGGKDLILLGRDRTIYYMGSSSLPAICKRPIRVTEPVSHFFEISIEAAQQLGIGVSDNTILCT